MFTICKQFTFSASHQLDRLPLSHKCAHLHGHNYVVAVVMASPDNKMIATSDALVGWSPHQWVRDYAALDVFRQFIDAELDHKDLNAVMTPEFLDQHFGYRGAFTPTAEMLAYLFYKMCRFLFAETFAVRVSETPDTWAEYYE